MPRANAGASLADPLHDRSMSMWLPQDLAQDDGQASSVLVGLGALSARLDAVIVALADQPLVNSQDIGALIGAFKKRGGAAMVVPRVDGAPGNPVICDPGRDDRAAPWHAAGRGPGRLERVDDGVSDRRLSGSFSAGA